MHAEKFWPVVPAHLMGCSCSFCCPVAATALLRAAVLSGTPFSPHAWSSSSASSASWCSMRYEFTCSHHPPSPHKLPASCHVPGLMQTGVHHLPPVVSVPCVLKGPPQDLTRGPPAASALHSNSIESKPKALARESQTPSRNGRSTLIVASFPQPYQSWSPCRRCPAAF